MIWSDAYLNQVLEDAAKDVNTQVPCLFHRYFLAIVSGISVYTLPEKTKTIRSIYYRGLKLEETSWIEFTDISNGSFFVDNSTNIETTGKPRFWAKHPTNIHDIRFFPTPGETFVTTGDPYAPTVDEARCTVECWREVDTSDALSSLPDYIDRRTRKAYSLWKAFGKEGKGQNTQASLYYKNRYNVLIEFFKRINNGCFLAKFYSIEGQLDYNRTPPKPVLPTNYERVEY